MAEIVGFRCLRSMIAAVRRDIPCRQPRATRRFLSVCQQWRAGKTKLVDIHFTARGIPASDIVRNKKYPDGEIGRRRKMNAKNARRKQK
ncbi:hypothetical protein [Herbaspirillum robiniae]|uniref:hypothetical protein n=1 Tax=Herbaspirillum robiniae TaxID=2014887 RepID=UPI003D7715D9